MLKIEALEAIQDQLDALRWLLNESLVDPSWQIVVTNNDLLGGPEGMLGVVLTRASKRILVLSHHEQCDNEKHFWIDGNHQYGQFAITILKARLQGE